MSVTYTVECTVLSNTEILPLVSVHYLKKKEKKRSRSWHNTEPTKTEHCKVYRIAVYIIRLRVRKVEQETENTKHKV